MLVASILPQKYISMTIGDEYQLALAHLVDEPGYELYTDALIHRAAGTFVILDNGCYEGAMVEPDELIRKAKLINADCVVLPDVFNDAKGTIELVSNYIDTFKEELPGTQLMGVAHGTSFEEGLWSVSTLLILGVDIISIPKVYMKNFGAMGRRNFLRTLGHLLDGTPVHLLGAGDSPIELKAITKDVDEGKIVVPILGVDSSLPYVYARENMRIDEGPRPDKPIDFATNAEIDIDLLRENINFWKSECNGLPKDEKIVHMDFVTSDDFTDVEASDDDLTLEDWIDGDYCDDNDWDY